MTEIEPDRNRLRSTAAGIFARHGVDFAGGKRGGSWSNAAWPGGGLALRLAVVYQRWAA